MIELPITRLDVQTGRARLDERTRRWVLEELTPLTHREAYERAPWLAGRDRYAIGPSGQLQLDRHFYRCANHDETSGLCTAHESRPSTCRSFPTAIPGHSWPDPEINLPPACAYRADVGLPIEVRR